MTQVKGITINDVVVRSRAWYLVLAVIVGWATVGLPRSNSQAQDDFSRPGVGNDFNRPGVRTDDYNLGPDGRPLIGPDGKPLDGRKQQIPILNWMIRASGIFGFLIMLVAFAMIAIIMSIAVQLRRDNYLPTAFIEEYEQQLQAKDYAGAYETAKNSDSFIGRIMSAGMARLGPTVNYDEAIKQMQQVGEQESMAMEHKIGYLALIGSISPMLGLLGTMQGMVLSFYAIANSSSLPKPSELADGVATAIVTTLEGLVVAIPAIVFYSLYKNRLARFLMECGFVAENLMNNFKGITNSSTLTNRTTNVESSVSHT